MASTSQVKRYQDEVTRLRGQSAKESAKIGAARVKANKASADAAKTSNAASVRAKISEAQREEKKATDAEKARAALDKKIAAAESSLFTAQRKYTAETEKEQKQALNRLTSTLEQRERQFRPTISGPTAVPRTENSARDFAPTHDVFISHASEDKEDFVRPLQKLLAEREVSTWLDELDIGWGHSIRQSIDSGIAGCRFGLVVISPHFLTKKWTRAELDGLYGRQIGETESGGFILPVWHKVTADDVQQAMPTIAGLKALSTALFTTEQIADEIANLVNSER